MTTGEIKGLIEILSLAVPSGKGKGEKEKRDRLEITKQDKKMKKMDRERFLFCQRDPCLLPIFLLFQIEDVDFAFYLSFDFVTLILRPVYLLLFNNKARSNTHSYFSKIALLQSSKFVVFMFEFFLEIVIELPFLKNNGSVKVARKVRDYSLMTLPFLGGIQTLLLALAIMSFLSQSPPLPSTRYFDRDHRGKSSKSLVPDKYQTSYAAGIFILVILVLLFLRHKSVVANN